MDQDKLYLHHILDAVNLIDHYVAGLTFEQFAAGAEHQITRDAVVRQFQIIGEASKNLSADFKQREATVPWRDIGDMRNMLIHEYVGINYEIVWQAIQHDLPLLKRVLSSKIDKSKP